MMKKKSLKKGMLRTAIIILMLTLITTITTVQKTSAFEPTTPHNETTYNDQPLLSWTPYEETITKYEVILATNKYFTENKKTYETTNTYYQLQEPLSPGKWYWRVKAYNETMELETSPTAWFTVEQRPTFTVTPDTSNYQKDKSVKFIIDAPQGTKTNITIKNDNYELPFVTDSLNTNSFTTFLEPGTYLIEANFIFEGLPISYTSTFTVKEETSQTTETTQTEEENNKEYQLTITIINEEGTKIKDAIIRIKGNNTEETTTTNENGTINKTLKKGKYNITITKEEYEEEKETITLEENTTRTIIIRKKTQEPLPTLTIKGPSTNIGEQYPLSYETNKPENIKDCTILNKGEKQKGWMINQKTTIQEKNNNITITLEEGKQEIKMRCETKDGRIIYSNEQTTTIIKEEGIKETEEFLKELDKIDDRKNPSFIKTPIKQAKEELETLLEELKKEYENEQLTQAEKTVTIIRKKIEEYKKTIIKEVSEEGIKRGIALPEPTLTKNAIKWYLQRKNLEHKKTIEWLMEKQSDYTIRTEKKDYKITYLDGRTTYKTVINRKIQSFNQENNEEITIIDTLPEMFRQQAGIPTVMMNEKPTGIIINDYLIINATTGEEYQLIFDGKTNTEPIFKGPLAIIPSTIPEPPKGIISTVTGAATSITGGTGTEGLIIIALIMITLIIITGPAYNIKDYNKKRITKKITKELHKTATHLEQGRHEKAIRNHEKAIKLLTKIPEKEQEKIRPIINHANKIIEEKLLTEAINKTKKAIISGDKEKTKKAIKELIMTYQTMSRETREKHKQEIINIRKTLT